MNEPSYEFNRIGGRLTYEFESISNLKSINKLIEFRLINSENILFNLALVDILGDGTTSDLIVSNNNDMPKVISTVYKAISKFYSKIPFAKVSFEGSTKSRTRLYQIAISKYLPELEQNFNIFGFLGNIPIKFEKGINFDSFLVSRKSKNYENT